MYFFGFEPVDLSEMPTLTTGYIISAMIMAHVPRKVQFICSGLLLSISTATLGITLMDEMVSIRTDTRWHNHAQ